MGWRQLHLIRPVKYGHSPGQVLSSCVFPLTQKTIWTSCAEAAIQDKKSPDIIGTRNSVTESKLWQIRKKLKGGFGKQTYFSQRPKQSEPPSIPLSPPLPRGWSDSVKICGAAKASLLVVGELGSITSNNKVDCYTSNMLAKLDTRHWLLLGTQAWSSSTDAANIREAICSHSGYSWNKAVN